MTDPTSPDTAPSATTGAAPAAATRRRWWLVLVGVVAAIVVGNLTIVAAFGVARALAAAPAIQIDGVDHVAP